MASGRWITRAAEARRLAFARLAAAGAALGAVLAASPALASAPAQASAPAPAPCAKPVYLTFDTGHMAVAPLIADVLARQHVKVTFFAANEPTKEGDGSLGEHWAGWWKARAVEGHEFASHTFDHAYWRADVPASQPGEPPRFRIRPSAGPKQGVEETWTAAQYCAEVAKAADRLAQVTGK